MAYLEEAAGRPASSYSAALLEIDQDSGPWLAQTQRSSPVAQGHFPRFDADLEEGVIWFGDEETNGLVARFHAIGSYSPTDGAFVWCWTNEQLATLSEVPQQIAADHPEVGEFTLTLIKGDEIKAWTLAAAVAYLMKAEACFRLPGELQLFVALTDITAIDAADPRYPRRGRDPEAAQEALREFAGPAALRIGAALLEAARAQEPELDPVVAVIHRLCERLDAMSRSPVGRETPAAAEAGELAGRLRQAALSLSLPPGHPDLAQAVQGALEALEATARHYGAWPENGGKRV